ncbi:sensor histidine kinase [Myxococcus xanthus]|uniref:sensor histidine kinase n=1 Tax=Myxococcus xanthus TaxID=34 RepID=UPI0011299A67|nr:HAMP domain-containing sensor histidine kinase [Myxococcus xanthus]QDE86461.1 histidine kinase [Myxococcus xanthus]QDF00621.1 histidine kinase [Myxococcus xanthus]QDF08437.1 histidine kinase [Myxococcus xanthus]
MGVCLSSKWGSAWTWTTHAGGAAPCLRFETVRGTAGEVLDLRQTALEASAEPEGHDWVLPSCVSCWEQEGVRGLRLEDCVRVVDTGEPVSVVLRITREGMEARFRAVGMKALDAFVLWLLPDDADDAQALREALAREREARLRAEGALEHATARLTREALDGNARHLALERLTEEAEFRERFIGILGHDLRNPLNAIALSARAMAQRTLPAAQQQQCAQRIEASAARMGAMISDILDLTRARLAGGIPLHLGTVSLAIVCRMVVEELSAAHPDRHITLDVEGASEGFWDADRLAQVLSNLVSNALEHGAEDTPVRLKCIAVDGEQVLEVHNTGTPIPSQQLETLFDPFRQVGTGPEKGHRRGAGGLGLGLFIVKQIVQAHGGAVCVSSSEAEGTTFTVKMPRDARQSQAPAPSGVRHRV